MSTQAKNVLSRRQKILITLLIVFLLAALLLNYVITVIAILSVLTFFYTLNIFISLYLTIRSTFLPNEIEVVPEEYKLMDQYGWPKYTILCPLYKEANVLFEFTEAIKKLDYPKDHLECLLLLEEDDDTTIKRVRELKLPSYFKTCIIPPSYPRTKPKACNFGLARSSGDVIVIYDAEDRPDADQLKKVVVTFFKSKSEVGCVQAKLNYYNSSHNFLTKMFTSEYTLWFDLVLPGLQGVNAPIPLGGTSNHFKSHVLQKLHGWDPYNVTEDCDLGIRLFEAGYKTVILNSTTGEEANCEIRNWIRQRSRWIKGYFQTFLVHSRNPISAIRKIGFFNFSYFMLITGFLPFASLINPFLWATTFVYFAFRPIAGGFIEQFYPSFLLGPAVFCLVFGNLLYVYNYLIATAKKEYHAYTKFGLLMPIYWFLISVAGWYGLIQLFFKPHFWEKTKHGLALNG